MPLFYAVSSRLTQVFRLSPSFFLSPTPATFLSALYLHTVFYIPLCGSSQWGPKTFLHLLSSIFLCSALSSCSFRRPFSPALNNPNLPSPSHRQSLSLSLSLSFSRLSRLFAFSHPSIFCWPALSYFTSRTDFVLPHHHTSYSIMDIVGFGRVGGLLKLTPVGCPPSSWQD